MGDFNALVGCHDMPQSECVGKFGYGKMNDRGSKLIDFCVENELIVTNTFYDVPMIRRYTYKAPGDICRYQNDFILVIKRFRNQIKSSHAYPGFDIDSDHN